MAMICEARKTFHAASRITNKEEKQNSEHFCWNLRTDFEGESKAVDEPSMFQFYSTSETHSLIRSFHFIFAVITPSLNYFSKYYVQPYSTSVHTELLACNYYRPESVVIPYEDIDR